MSKSIPSEIIPAIFFGARFTTKIACFPSISRGSGRSGYDSTLVVAKAEFQRDQLLGIENIANPQNCPNTEVDLIEDVGSGGWF
jgi:hypothetical protein